MNLTNNAVVLFLSTMIGVSSGLVLDKDNIDEMTAGKTVYIKFFAPWCGHCKAMASDWEKLMDDYKDHPVALVGEVDCTNDKNDELCEEFDVQGFPTIKWGNRDAPEDYDGGRDYESLKAFAEEHVTKASCSVLQTDACSDEEKKEIAEVEGYSDDKLQETVQSIKTKVTEEEKKFEDEVDKLQKLYEDMTNAHNKKMDGIKTEYKFKYVSQIMKKRGLKIPDLDNPDDDDDDDDDDDTMTGGEL